MRREKILLVQGDRRPRITVEVYDAAADAEDVVLLDEATGATLRLRAVGSTEVLATITCAIQMPSQITWQWPVGVLDDLVGEYEGEIEILFGDEPHTLYDPLRFKIRAQF